MVVAGVVCAGDYGGARGIGADASPLRLWKGPPMDCGDARRGRRAPLRLSRAAVIARVGAAT